MEWYLPSEKPTHTGLSNVIFCDDLRYYMGRTGADGKWYETGTDCVLDAINAWAFVPEGPSDSAAMTAIEEWIAGNGPVSSSYSHFLLFDYGEVTYANINSNYFDSFSKTFKEVSHYLILPNVPLRLFSKAIIIKHMQAFLKEIMQKSKLIDLKLNRFLERCLFIALKEMFHTSINGVRQNYAVQGDDFLKEVVNRWTFQVNQALNKAMGKNYIIQPLGTVTAPTDRKEQQESQDTIDRVCQTILC